MKEGGDVFNILNKGLGNVFGQAQEKPKQTKTSQAAGFGQLMNALKSQQKNKQPESRVQPMRNSKVGRIQMNTEMNIIKSESTDTSCKARNKKTGPGKLDKPGVANKVITKIKPHPRKIKIKREELMKNHKNRFRSRVIGTAAKQNLLKEQANTMALLSKDIGYLNKAKQEVPQHNQIENKIQLKGNTGGTVEMEIIWEFAEIENTLKQQGIAEYSRILEGFINAANYVLKKYIQISSNTPTDISIQRGNHCGTKVNETINFKGHLIVFLKLVNQDNTTIASAAPCMTDDNGRTITGVMNINKKFLIKDNQSYILKRKYIYTIIHEFLHIIAFNEDDSSAIFKGIRENKHKHIKAISDSGNNIYENGHWSSDYLFNDIMIPKSDSNLLFSIFTLEFIEHVSPSYFGQRQNLQKNFLLDKVVNPLEYFNFKCMDGQQPKYSVFCSSQQVQQKKDSCSDDFMFKGTCSKTKNKNNNCYKKELYANGFCLDETNKKTGNPFESFGPASRCFEEVSNGKTLCLRYQVESNKVKMIINNSQYICERSHEVKDISVVDPVSKGVYKIQVKCPNIDEFINAHKKTSCPYNCYYNGLCSEGKCICFGDFDETGYCKTYRSVSSTRFLVSRSF